MTFLDLTHQKEHSNSLTKPRNAWGNHLNFEKKTSLRNSDITRNRFRLFEAGTTCTTLKVKRYIHNHYTTWICLKYQQNHTHFLHIPNISCLCKRFQHQPWQLTKVEKSTLHSTLLSKWNKIIFDVHRLYDKASRKHVQLVRSFWYIVDLFHFVKLTCRLQRLVSKR